MVLVGLLVVGFWRDFEGVEDVWEIVVIDIDPDGDFVEYAFAGILPTLMKVELNGDVDGDLVVHSP